MVRACASAAREVATARGERDWVPGREPVFPVETPDDTAPGTVWLTSTDEEDTTWLVASRDFPRSVPYARLTPGVRAGTVTVALAATDAGSEVTVTYDMTPLTPEAAEALDAFAFAADYGRNPSPPTWLERPCPSTFR
ncbi:hypothetical protein ACFVJM_24745 [Streptomyces virginiae]|uniref:hypothetical protein n=1 Tax=Streptomyces virginiae TaxID=1961 RepID=UPI003635C8DF